MTRRAFVCALSVLVSITYQPTVAAGQTNAGKQSSKKLVGKWEYWGDNKHYPRRDFEILASGKVLVEGIVATYEIIDAKRIQMSYRGHTILYTYAFTKKGELNLETSSSITVVYKGFYKRKKS